MQGREENEAFAAAGAGGVYVVYFPNGGSVRLKAAPGEHSLRWIDIGTGEWGPEGRLSRADGVPLTPPGPGHWAAVIGER